MAERPLGIGIVGCGSVAEQYLAQTERLAGRGLARVVAACGRERQRSTVVEGWGIARFTTDHREILGMPDVDIVVVLTSMNAHAEIAGAALAAGKHVLCEKPMATTLDDAAALLALARRSPGHLVCAPFTVLSPTFQAIGARLRAGEIGRVVSARGRYGWAGPWWGEWFYRRGGGVLRDLAVYNVTTLTGWLGPVARVSGLSGTAIPERTVDGKALGVEVEDNAHLLLEFESGALAAVTAGFTIQQYRGPALELWGTDGALQMLGDDWDPDGYEIWRRDVGSWRAYKETAPEWPWSDGLRHLVECVHAGTRPQVTPAHAFHVVEVLLAAERACAEGAARTVESGFEPLAFAAPAHAEPAHLIHDRTRDHRSA